MGLFGFERIVEDYEARLAPVTGAGVGDEASGKSEWERYGSGEEEFNVRVRKLEVPDDAVLEVLLNGAAVGQVRIRKGRGKLAIRSRYTQVPKAVAGDSVVLRLEGRPVLEGTYVPD